jgi:hypothetical protein
MSIKTGCVDAFFQHLPVDEVKISLLFITWTELGGVLPADELKGLSRLIETCHSNRKTWSGLMFRFP